MGLGLLVGVGVLSVLLFRFVLGVVGCVGYCVGVYGG